MNTANIFIASSSELSEDRKEFREFLSVENDSLHEKGAYIKLVQWEHFLDAISETRLQDEYNKTVREADIVICLFYTKAGKYTQEEFDTALKQFKETGRPIIYTYFKTGAPDPDPNDQLAKDLVSFKERLGKLGHFWTTYENIHDLKFQFLKQLHRLEKKGLIDLGNELKEEAGDAISSYLTIYAEGDVHVGDKIEGDKVEGDKIEISNSKNVNTGNVNTQGGDVHIGDVNDNTININFFGSPQSIPNELPALKKLLEQKGISSFYLGGETLNLEDLNPANFGYIIGQAGRAKSLPAELAENLVGEGKGWVKSLKQELQDKHDISVGNRSWDIFQNYGWLIEAFLQKMSTQTGQEKNLRRLSFMAEAYQASLRYLCYIQMSQIIQLEDKPTDKIIADFLNMEGSSFQNFDYISLLLTTTNKIGSDGFMPEINRFTEELIDSKSSLNGVSLFLKEQRQKLINNELSEDENLPILLDQYLTALVYWLRKVSFLAKYRMVSIKEINLDYRFGTTRKFVHLYGELHGIYSDGDLDDEDYNTKSIEGAFTYNKSVLLFKGDNVSAGLDSIENKNAYLSLSPLIIDQSVYLGKPTQTPEIFFFSSYNSETKQYEYSQYRNELAFGEMDTIASNKSLIVKYENNNQPLLNRLFEQLELIFKPFKR